MKTRIILLFALFGWILSSNAQEIVSGGGACLTTGDPDLITDIDVIDQLKNCFLAKDSTNGDFYTYDPTQTVGSRWNIANSSGESTTVDDTDNVDLTLSGTEITADVIIDPAAGNRLTTSAAGLLVAAEADGSTTNELQTIAVTSDATSATVTLSDSGGSVTIEEGDGIEVTESGGTVTITNTQASKGYYKNDADASDNGVAIGEMYKTAHNNTLGFRKGVPITREY